MRPYHTIKRGKWGRGIVRVIPMPHGLTSGLERREGTAGCRAPRDSVDKRGREIHVFEKKEGVLRLNPPPSSPSKWEGGTGKGKEKW